LMETLEHVRHEVRVHEVWLSGDPAVQVLGFARDNHVDIIACGCCSGSPPQDARSFATKVLEGSPLPVLLVPACAPKPEAAVAFDRLNLEVAP
jgi:nucleotide-binding universal stress UspA family protein